MKKNAPRHIPEYCSHYFYSWLFHSKTKIKRIVFKLRKQVFEFLRFKQLHRTE